MQYCILYLHVPSIQDGVVTLKMVTVQLVDNLYKEKVAPILSNCPLFRGSNVTCTQWKELGQNYYSYMHNHPPTYLCTCWVT